ncbi:paraquat-inducible protein A [Bordetella petrii]|uniref:Paraquat-inducible protein A n=1 Tax=Bordetella petrii (strain ATCC BAA-461 / DSM 12804 / CCUG 43448 / CIP 107267 / Se-1111R) TaxID=340100 RepID=A9IPZ0_BORPD|nr:paraquat-inducible protein A [Bordetella petrii]CAP43000.1 paraquat-inducible protein A [Bordetella petrii]
MAREPLISCEHCASIFRRHELQRGETATCSRCGTILWRYSGLSVSGWLALTLTALIVFVVANGYPVVSMSVRGLVRDASLLDAVAMTWQQGYVMTATMTGLAGFGLPLLQLCLLAWVLWPLTRGREPRGLRPAMRLLGMLRPWCMVPVFLLGVVVAVVKLAGMARVGPEPGLYAFAVLTVLLTMLSRLSPHAIWRYAEESGVAPVHVPRAQPGQLLAGCHVCGQVQALAAHDHDGPAPRCMRCRAVLHYRKPDSLARTWALLLAAAVLYVPANVLPIMNINSLFFGDSGHTILGGVVELWHTGSWDIALIVFVASIVVPLTKILALVVLAIAVQLRSQLNLRQRTRLYELVEFIGQWSMLDVFVVILLSALAHFQGLFEISAGPAAGAFGLVVILTMLAAMSFDPRTAWDQAPRGEAGADRPAGGDMPAAPGQNTA